MSNLTDPGAAVPYNKFVKKEVVYDLMRGGAGMAAATAGCDSSQLETGYRYRRLGASDNERRAYYAPEYSREAAMAGAQRESSDVSNMARRRPGASQY